MKDIVGIFTGEGWKADVVVGSVKPDYSHVYSTVEGVSAAAALAGAKWVLDTFACNRFAAIRVHPEVTSEKDFATQITRHRALVRFVYKLEAGAWQDVIQTAPIIGLGSHDQRAP